MNDLERLIKLLSDFGIKFMTSASSFVDEVGYTEITISNRTSDDELGPLIVFIFDENGKFTYMYTER